MECPYKECVYAEDCAIIDITKKVPKKMDSCSYCKKKKGSEAAKKDKNTA